MADTVFATKQLEITRLLRFMTVGLVGTLLDFTVLMSLKELLLMPTLLANTLSFSAGVVNNFTWNRLWTFADARSANVFKQFMQFTAVSIIGLLLNNLIVIALETPFAVLLGAEGYGYLPAKVVATGIVFMWNFTANRRLTFNPSLHGSAA
ncbi:MAG: GtrA family protein [Anaerolineales bacterium]|nr:GtrA family protein [Anaerolineales bacterium]